MNTENKAKYAKLISGWDQAMQEYYCAEVIFDQLDNCSSQVAQHIMRSWQKLAVIENPERGASLNDLSFETVKELLPEDVFPTIRANVLTAWQENMSTIFRAGVAASEGVPQPAALPESILREQLQGVWAALRNYRRGLDRHHKMRLRDILYRRKRPIAITFILLATVVYSALGLAFDSFNPKYWGLRRYNNLGIITARQDWSALSLGQSVEGRALSIGGQSFTSGLGTHANSKIEVWLPSGHSTFSGACGVDGEAGEKGSVVCQVKDDEEILFESPVLKGGDTPAAFSIPLEGKRRLSLVVTNGGDNIDSDHADWVDLKLD